jgi:hypothetical protein
MFPFNSIIRHSLGPVRRRLIMEFYCTYTFSTTRERSGWIDKIQCARARVPPEQDFPRRQDLAVRTGIVVLQTLIKYIGT